MVAVRKEMKRSLAFVVAMIVFMSTVIASIPGSLLKSKGAGDGRVTDPSTMNGWTSFFGEDVLSTENAGRIWTDKSVFTSADAFNNSYITLSDPNNFLVALSAISSNKSIVGYSNIPFISPR